jgi:hypothetical protein
VTPRLLTQESAWAKWHSLGLEGIDNYLTYDPYEIICITYKSRDVIYIEGLKNVELRGKVGPGDDKDTIIMLSLGFRKDHQGHM